MKGWLNKTFIMHGLHEKKNVLNFGLACSHVCALEDAAQKLRWIAMFGAKFLFKWSVYSFLRENLSLT